LLKKLAGCPDEVKIAGRNLRPKRRSANTPWYARPLLSARANWRRPAERSRRRYADSRGGRESRGEDAGTGKAAMPRRQNARGLETIAETAGSQRRAATLVVKIIQLLQSYPAALAV
jgi:hypothetical protein